MNICQIAFQFVKIFDDLTETAWSLFSFSTPTIRIDFRGGGSMIHLFHVQSIFITRHIRWMHFITSTLLSDFRNNHFLVHFHSVCLTNHTHRVFTIRFSIDVEQEIRLWRESKLLLFSIKNNRAVNNANKLLKTEVLLEALF